QRGTNVMNAFWRTALDGSSFERLAPPLSANETIAMGSFACTASPDGRALVFVRLVGGFTQLVRFDLPSGHEQPLTTSGSEKYEAAWSPDGRWIAFSANTGGAVNVWRIPTGSGSEQQLTAGSDRIRHLFYSPDGKWL